MSEGLPLNTIAQSDALAFARSLPDASVDCCLTSPPYYLLRNYNVAGQWGSEATLDEYLHHLWALYGEVRRALKPTGTCFVNLGDTYMNDAGGQNGGANNTLDYGKANGRISAKIVEANRQAGRQHRKGVARVPKKSLLLIPERFAIGMVGQGWTVRNKIAWTKPNAMPSSVRDRFACTWEHVWFFTKQERYWSDLDAVRVPHSSATIQRIMQTTAHEQKGGPKQDKFWENTGRPPQRNPRDIVKSLAAKYGNEPPRRGGLDGVELGKPFCDRYFTQLPKSLTFRREGSKRGQPLQAGNTATHREDRADTEYSPLGRNPGDTWDIPTQPMPDAHFAVWPEELARRIIRFGCPPDGVAYDPFMGSGTTALVALQEGRNFVGSELNPEYLAIAERRIRRETGWAKRVPLLPDVVLEEVSGG